MNPKDDSQDMVMVGVFMALVIINIFFDFLVGAFIFKVWNERQMTHQYARQAAAQERIARAAEERAAAPIAQFDCKDDEGCFPIQGEIKRHFSKP